MEISNLYVFNGNFEAMIKTRINRLVDEILNEYTCDIIKHEGLLTNINNIIADAATIPLGFDHKIIIIKNPAFLKIKEDNTTLKYFNDYLKKPAPYTTIIINCFNCEIEKTNIIYKTILKQANIIDVKDVDDIEIGGIIKRKLIKENVEITDEALKLLLDYLNRDLIRAEAECNKLVEYKNHEGTLTTDDIYLLVNKDFDITVYDLTNAVMNKDRNKILAIYHELTANSLDAVGILAVIANTLTLARFTISMLKRGFTKNEVATLAKVNQGRIHYLTQNIKKFDLDELDDYITNLAIIDEKIKTGQIDKNLGLELILMKM